MGRNGTVALQTKKEMKKKMELRIQVTSIGSSYELTAMASSMYCAREMKALPLIVCNYCFKAFTRKRDMIWHMKDQCSRVIPGTLIYQYKELSVYEVDPSKYREFCEALATFGKLFFTAEFDFNTRFIGFPGCPWVARFRKAFARHVRFAICRYFRENEEFYKTETYFQIMTISKITGIHPFHVTEFFSAEEWLIIQNGRVVSLQVDLDYVTEVERKLLQSGKYIKLKKKRFQWTPSECSPINKLFVLTQEAPKLMFIFPETTQKVVKEIENRTRDMQLGPIRLAIRTSDSGFSTPAGFVEDLLSGGSTSASEEDLPLEETIETVEKRLKRLCCTCDQPGPSSAPPCAFHFDGVADE
ncbi:unnamed protein product [Caenorhabditis sp. 36 PRJEB53466]|nr:unnamed protein product [Caenorhabditis sp. 36 PRJEB53466]